MLQKLNLKIFTSLVIGLMLSSPLISCTNESSSNTEIEDGSTVTTDENGNVNELDCGSEAQVFIDGVDVCAE